MSKDILIKKGLDLKLQGEADIVTSESRRSAVYTIRPDDFHGVIPKLITKQGAKVNAGSPVFFSKTSPSVKFVSPVSGEISEIVRGEKRKILEIRIKADTSDTFHKYDVLNIDQTNAEEIKTLLLESGCWPFVKQRPYDVIANPDKAPKAIFVSAYNSEPLAADVDYFTSKFQTEVSIALKALGKLTSGKVHVGVHKNSTQSIFRTLEDVEVHNLSGVHPVGNVGTQINKIDPVNKGEVVWTVTPQDLIVIGNFLLTGEFNAKRLVAVTGSEVNTPKYVQAIAGASMEDVLEGNLTDTRSRIINGSVFTGKTATGFLGYYSNQISVIEEGDDYDFFGWNIPRPNKFSTLRANMFSFLTPKKKYALNTNTNGEHRAMVLTGHYEKVFPLDIYPMQLIKACLYKDIDEMEALGIYEVAPEDFALVEFVCPSKTNHQHIIREALDLMIKEVG